MFIYVLYPSGNIVFRSLLEDFYSRDLRFIVPSEARKNSVANVTSGHPTIM